MWFKAILGLKVNSKKTKLILVERVVNLEDLSMVLGYNLKTLPIRYLRLMLEVAFN